MKQHNGFVDKQHSTCSWENLWKGWWYVCVNVFCCHLHTVLCNPLSRLWWCMLSRKTTWLSSDLIMLSFLLSW